MCALLYIKHQVDTHSSNMRRSVSGTQVGVQLCVQRVHRFVLNRFD